MEAGQPEDAVAEWTVHLAAQQPGRAAATTAVIVLAAGWASILFGHPVWSVVTAGLLVGATSEFLFPVRYRLTATFAEARGPLHWRRIAWPDVKRVYVGKAEVKLSPLRFGGPREAFRGVVLRTDGAPDALLERIRELRAAVEGESAEKTVETRESAGPPD